MVYAYLAVFPEFVPEKGSEVSISEQKDFYDLMKKLYQLLFDDPSLIFPTLHEDDAFPSRYKKGYGKPELETNVLKIKSTIEKLLTASNCKLALAYANPAWGNEQPNGGNEYKIKHTGISAQYDAYVRNPTALGLCIPYGMKKFLENFDSMNQKVKDFVTERTKKCDGCRYCIQTDKTGVRPLACMSITNKQTKYKLCPYFPGYNYSWTSIDDSIVDNIIELLTFMDTFANSIMQKTR